MRRARIPAATGPSYRPRVRAAFIDFKAIFAREQSKLIQQMRDPGPRDTRVPGLLACDQAPCMVRATTEDGMGKHLLIGSNCRSFVKPGSAIRNTPTPFRITQKSSQRHQRADKVFRLTGPKRTKVVLP